MATYPADPQHHCAPDERVDARRTTELSAAAGDPPAIRADRVAEVRRRLAGGYYHAVMVRGKVADGVGRVLRELDLL